MTIVLGLVLMPVLFRTLPKEELGVWLLLGQSWATLGILDLGFGVTLTRRIAFAKGRSGSDPNIPLSGTTRAEIADLVATGMRIYRVLSGFAFTVSFGLGFIYLRTLELDAVSLPSVWLAWGALCLSQALTVWATPWTCLLQGVGYVGWDAILASFVAALMLIGQIIAALCGGGLVSLAIVAAGGALGQRAVILTFARRKRPELFELKGTWHGDVFRGMVPLASRAWLTALGSGLLLYSDQFVITSMEGASELPAYRAAWVLVHNLTVVATTFGMASGVFVSHLWQVNDLKEVHRIMERNVRFGWLTMLGGAGVLLFAGDSLFSLWIGPGNFIGYPILIAFLVTETLEAQSYIVSCAARATGDEAFAWSYLLAGGLKLGLSIVLARQYGLIGVALGTVIALLLTNHWYVPWRGMRSIRYSRWLLIGRTVVPCAVWFAALAVVLKLCQVEMAAFGSLFKLTTTITITAIAFLAALPWLVLDSAQRNQLWGRLFHKPLAK